MAPELLRGRDPQRPGNLATAPGRMLGTNRKNRSLRRRHAARRECCGRRDCSSSPSSRPIGTLQPFVAGRRADTETTAQLTNVGSFHRCQHYKLQPRVHSGHLVKRHPTASLIRCRKCTRCLRTPVHHVPGLNKGGGRGRGSRAAGVARAVRVVSQRTPTPTLPLSRGGGRLEGEIAQSARLAASNSPNRAVSPWLTIRSPRSAASPAAGRPG